MLFLAVRKALNFRIPLTYTVVVAAFAWLFPRIDGTRLESVMYEVLTGAVLFAGFFMVSDPVTSPSTNAAKYVYGAGCGILVMLFQYFGAYQIGVAFALLLMNSLSQLLDRMVMSVKYGFKKPRLWRTSRIRGFLKPPKVQRKGDASDE